MSEFEKHAAFIRKLLYNRILYKYPFFKDKSEDLVQNVMLDLSRMEHEGNCRNKILSIGFRLLHYRAIDMGKDPKLTQFFEEDALTDSFENRLIARYELNRVIDKVKSMGSHYVESLQRLMDGEVLRDCDRKRLQRIRYKIKRNLK